MDRYPQSVQPHLEQTRMITEYILWYSRERKPQSTNSMMTARGKGWINRNQRRLDWGGEHTIWYTSDFKQVCCGILVQHKNFKTCDT